MLLPKSPFVYSRRFLSAQQAAVALRPFYFAVHPDRFGRDPEIRNNNEKALQIFNGYLNELFPTPSSSQKPIQVNFAIKRLNGGETENITIRLSGNDPIAIVRTALEKCHLNADHVPAPKTILSSSGSAGSFGNIYDRYWQAKSNTSTSEDELWREMHVKDTIKRKKSVNGNSLLECLARNRENAFAKTEAFQKTTELINDEISYVMNKTGVRKIIWTINWDQTYLRRCLANILNMITQADRETRESITHALRNKTLTFGRGSYVCCDGYSLQFGADDATGAWQKVCMEANIRRFEVGQLKRLVSRVEELLGNKIYVNPYGNLLLTIQQMQSIIVRINSQSTAEKAKLRNIARNGLTLEIVSSYHELAMLRNGRLQIPCNVDIVSLRVFLKQHAVESRTASESILQKENEIDELTDKCCQILNLRHLTWDSQLSLDAVAACLKKLRKIDESLKNTIDGLGIHLSSNASIYVMSNGSVAIPIDLL
ncbi:hypothetical protein DdX_07325 [Ditylenchus destructor]|uniref:T-cell activation inhibitor, mitochondrial n=1 Tax=Ditylenchus destructor TaxID=166010 RepID=A0AAD4R806_9BILA|nr:hypothetical protein DdX_07325 [Ditylenchus destructor]